MKGKGREEREGGKRGADRWKEEGRDLEEKSTCSEGSYLSLFGTTT